ncbi:MAG: hypothetical protein J0L92_25215 [Deltaproteobacteria bacterium]|nr:hypothetical protein [Deltaproteobacteria bacterium]
MSAPEREPRTIPREDVDDVVGVASELAEAEDARVRVEDMKDIAADLAIDPKHVEPAIETLASRRQAEADRAARAAASRRTWAVRLSAVVGSILALGLVCGLWTRSALAPRWVEVEQARSQVETVIDRRAHVESLWRDREPGLDRDAELAGAENRVGIERRRYDEAAAAYNAAASGLPHAAMCGLVGVPCHAPLASEISSFSPGAP